MILRKARHQKCFSCISHILFGISQFFIETELHIRFLSRTKSSKLVPRKTPPVPNPTGYTEAFVFRIFGEF